MKNINLTPRAQKLIKEAHNFAVDLKHSQLTHLHIFLSFFSSKYNQIIEAFDYFEIDIEDLRKKGKECLDSKFKSLFKDQKYEKTVASKKVKQLFTAAKNLSSKYEHMYVGLEHFFLCLFNDPDEFLIDLVNKTDINYDKVLDYVEKKLEEDDLIPSSLSDPEEEENGSVNQFNPNKYKYLNKYATNLNLQVIQNKITDLHLNEKLIKKLCEILCRKNKNNPLIIGEAGVGKTALVESLAQAIVENKCSDFLIMKNIYYLDVSMIIAGSKYRGEFEEKIKNIIKEILDDPFIILFIDEIHTIIGAGNPENGMDVANILKPYLARGEITCIGATTYDEYRKTIAKDPALSRRFQTIKIEEPVKSEVFSLLKNIKSSYETYHFINFSDDILYYIIDVADKYIEGRFPDKALDVIDQVGAKVKLKNFVKSEDMKAFESKIKTLASKQSKMYEKDFNRKMESIIKKYRSCLEEMFNKWKRKKYRIKKLDVLDVVSDKTNIPISELKQEESHKIKNLNNILKKEVLGQENQLNQIYKCLIRAKAGFRNINKPIASFLFAGPTGVGKTMTAKLIANNLFSNKNNFLFFDLSEYSDKASVNKLIGSSPGYIGYDKGGLLTEKVKRNPYSLILFDEIQKAHEDVVFLLLQILEEGKISDSSGVSIDFSNTVIVMTTNVGSQEVNSSSIGFVKGDQNSLHEVSKAVKKHFPADFLNRIDEIVSFNSLKDKDIKLIIKKELLKFKDELKEKNISTSYSPNLIEHIFKKIQFNNFGARQVLKTIQREIQTLIAEKTLCKSKISDLKISVKNDNICVI